MLRKYPTVSTVVALMHQVCHETMQVFEHGEALQVPEHPVESATTLLLDEQPRPARWKIQTLRLRLMKVAAILKHRKR